MSDDEPLPRTIGDGWSPDPAERRREITDQERLVSDMARMIEDFDLDDYQLGDL